MSLYRNSLILIALFALISAAPLSGCSDGGPIAANPDRSDTQDQDRDQRDDEDEQDDDGDGDQEDADDSSDDPAEEEDAEEEEDSNGDDDAAEEDTEEEQDVPEDIQDPRELCEGEWIGECRPLESDCGPSRDKIHRCGFCGEFLSVLAECGPRELCDYDAQGDARCRPCTAQDDCPDSNIQCEPGERGCRAWNEPYECAPNGVIRSLGICAQGAVCTDGACADAGSPRGSGCGSNRDCVGGACICGEEYRSRVPHEQSCFSDVADGYCTREPCDENPCQTGQEFCADFQEIGRFGGDRFCVGYEGCATRGAPCNNGRWSCRDLPARDIADSPLRWELGCWPAAFAAHGESCNPVAGDCVGDLCLRSSSSDTTTYCTSSCGEGASCPSNTACVEFPRNSGNHQCMALADQEPCLSRHNNELAITSATLRLYNSQGTANVCTILNPIY